MNEPLVNANSPDWFVIAGTHCSGSNWSDQRTSIGLNGVVGLPDTYELEPKAITNFWIAEVITWFVATGTYALAAKVANATALVPTPPASVQ